MVPAYGAAYVVSVKGNTGKKTVNVDINGEKYRVYEVDFEHANTNSVKKISAYDYKESAATTRDSEPDIDEEQDENQIYASASPVFKSNR